MLVSEQEVLRNGAAVMTCSVSAILAVVATVPAVKTRVAVREVAVAVLVASLGGLATAGLQPTIDFARFEYLTLGMALVGGLVVVYRLGAGLHGLGRRGLVIVLFGGVVLAVLPRLGGGGEAQALGYLAVLVGTLAFAGTQTVNRSLRGEAGAARILFWPSLLGLALYGPLAFRDWVEPPPAELAMLALNGIFAGAAVVATAAAFRHADAARLGIADPYEVAR